jgi:hypothetical protein
MTSETPGVYRHTQIGWVIIATSLLVFPIMIAALGGSHSGILLLPVCITLLALLFFGTLTVVVDESRLSLSFGLGAIRKSIALSDIRSFSPVRNPWYYGWGIRFTPVGRLYNVSGLSAVDLLLSNGRHIRVGTDEPDALVDALRRILGEPAPLSADERRSGTAAARRLSAIIGFGALAVAAIVLGQLYVGMRPPVVDISPVRLSVRGGFYGADIAMTDIGEVSLQDTIPRIVRKIGGFHAGNTLRGRFTLEVLGPGDVFINRGVPPYVVIKTAQSFLIVNFNDPQRTRALYTELRRYTGRSGSQ